MLMPTRIDISISVIDLVKVMIQVKKRYAMKTAVVNPARSASKLIQRVRAPVSLRDKRQNLR
jgi:hypothetical protein